MSTWTIENESVNQFDVQFKREKTTGTYIGAGEFYTGLKKGERVNVLRDTYTHPDGHMNVYYSCALIDGGCWLVIGDNASSIIID